MTSVLVNDELQTDLEDAARLHGCDLIHVDFAGGRLRLILDRPEGVTIKDCEHVSREVSALLDGLDFGSGHYTLEVSSPGLDRELYRAEDYEKFAGNPVKISWRDPRTSSNRTDTALLKTFQTAPEGAGQIVIEIGKEQHTIRLEDVVRTRLEPVL